jgi:hypothetical protein
VYAYKRDLLGHGAGHQESHPTLSESTEMRKLNLQNSSPSYVYLVWVLVVCSEYLDTVEVAGVERMYMSVWHPYDNLLPDFSGFPY